MKLALETKGLVLQAGPRAISDPFDLQVEEGQHVLVLGPSGCGKSTLLRTIAGLHAPRQGTLELFGQLTDDGRTRFVEPHQRGIGFLFQEGSLWPQWNVQQTLTFVLKQRGMAKAEIKDEVERLLEWVELPGFEKRSTSTLSGGEAQRIALARALACKPKLLLLDEPLGPLDFELRQGLLKRLHELRKELGLTLLHVTHDPQEARAFADVEVRLNHGRLRAPQPILKDKLPAPGTGEN
ncbi:MAG: ABC-type Fe3+/spermidine/putrescine transport system ATPase subunit [Planctomycetota bacterium]|jgi:ABC-type Fe3+/spermidine/putrescine transport system ATPase subunit